MSDSGSNSNGSNGSSNKNNTNSIDKCDQKIKAPQWSNDNIDAWITIVEAQFITCQIVKPISKFYHVVSVLPPEIVSRIYDVVSVEKPTDDSYSKLINALKTRLVKSKDNRLKFVLDEAQLGDMSPSQFYYHLKSLSKDLKLSDELIFNRWLKKLPNDHMKQTLIGLKASIDDIEKLLSTADALFECANHHQEVHMVSRRNFSQNRSQNVNHHRGRGGFNRRGRWCQSHFRFRDQAFHCDSPNTCSFNRGFRSHPSLSPRRNVSTVSGNEESEYM